MTKKRLFEEFPPVSSEEWRARVIADLKGADYEKNLVWKTEEGFDVQPYYRLEDLESLNTNDNSGQDEPGLPKGDEVGQTIGSSIQRNHEKIRGKEGGQTAEYSEKRNHEKITGDEGGQTTGSSIQGDHEKIRGKEGGQPIGSSIQRNPKKITGDEDRQTAEYSGQKDPGELTGDPLQDRAAAPYRKIARDWKIRQDFTSEPSPESLNRKILNAVTRGAQSIGINMSALPIATEASPATPPSGNSLKTQSDAFKKSLETMLAGIDLTATELNFLNAHQPLPLLQSLTGLAASTGADPVKINGSVGIDPVKKLTAEGELNEQAFDELSDCLKIAAAGLPGMKTITVDAGVIQDSGSTLSQELGFGLAMANDYFSRLTGRGHTPGEIAATMLFSFATGPNYFMEIAKLRAARWLWRAVCKEWAVEEKLSNMYIHSRTASWNLTLYDPHVNMLRTTTETMSASLGGSDTISVQPFDNTCKEENEFSSRIARNTQLILKEEAYFNKVADPAAGSYYIEQLTVSIAEQAWKHFLEAEERGGYIEAFKQGWIQEQVAASAELKRLKASSGRASILGVNKYPAFAEMILNQGISLRAKKEDEQAAYQPLKPFRIAEEIEQLRLQTEKSRKRPKVFLLKYGDPAWMTARGMFAGNFFACAGYDIVDNRGFESVEEGIAAAKKAKADIVVLCSADTTYPDAAPVVHEAMNGSAEIVIAGYPRDSLEQLQQQGVHHFIHVKSNLLEELQKFQKLLKINKA